MKKKKLSNHHQQNTINSKKSYRAMKGKYDTKKKNKEYDNKHTMQLK